MNSKTLFLSLSVALVVLNHTELAANEVDNRCDVYAPTLNEARAEYEQNCSLPRVDCDPINGQWVCSSHVIDNSATINVPALPDKPDISDSSDNADCDVIADSLPEAYQLYGRTCSEPRVDCDPIGGGQWMCASYNDPKPAVQSTPDPVAEPTPDPVTEPTPDPVTEPTPDPVTEPTPDPVTEPTPDPVTEPTPDPVTEPTPDPVTGSEQCEAVGSTLFEAIQNYANACDLPRKDCDPSGVNGGYICASYLDPEVDDGAVTQTPPVITPPPVTTPVPDKTPTTPTTTGQTLLLEAESASLSGSWVLKKERSGYTGNGYIQWTGRNYFGQPGVGALNYTFKVTKPGIYQLQLRSRSIGGADVTVNNDSWVRVVNGPAPYNVWVKAYQSVGDKWTHQTVAELSHSDRRFIRFYAAAGDLNVQVSGRSTGHAIDSLQLIPVSINSKQVNGKLPKNALFAKGDLLALHFDNAEDLNDGHANVADLMVVNHFDLRPSTLVISGEFSDNQEYSSKNATKFDPELAFPGSWGGEGSDFTWINADTRLAHAHNRSVMRWTKTLKAGNNVWVAEGGESDFTADVLRAIASYTPDVDLKNVFVIQHTHDQENAASTPWEVAYIEEVANYVRIPSGHIAGNGSAILNQRNDEVANRFLVDPVYGAAWVAAFSYLNPFTEAFDASDTVELLFIMGLEEDVIKDWTDFRNYFLPN